MAPPSPSTSTPRKDGKTEEQAQADLHRMLMDYNVTDNERDLAVPPPTAPSNHPPDAPAPARPKRPARTPKAKKPASATNHEMQESPLARKSTRLASKRSAPADSSEDPEAQPPAKKAKGAPSRAASKTSVGAPTPSTSSKGKKVTLPEQKKAVSPAPIQAHTGRFVPINSQIPHPTKIEKKAPAKKKPAVKTTNATSTNGDGDDANIEDVVEDVEDGGEASKGQGKGKNKAAASKAFVGTSDMMGSSTQKPDDAPNNQHWKCANRNCTSGQTGHDRDGPNSYGRKVISNFFGRNKRETNLIDANVWHNYCRKDYQRSTYRANNQSKKAKCDFYIQNIQMQLDRIKLWRPSATFQVQLSKGAKTRLDLFCKELVNNGQNHALAKRAVEKPAQVNAKGKEKPLSLEDAFPIEYIKHFDDNFNGTDKTFDEIDAVIAWTQGLVNAGSVDSMPPMEFLINQQADGEKIIDPTFNYERWAALEDETEFVTPNGSEAGGDDEETVDGEEDATIKEEAEDTGDEGDGENVPGLTDGASDGGETTESESESEEDTLTPIKPPKKRTLFLTSKFDGALLSSTYGATPGSGLASKRKRAASEHESESDDAAVTTPSKKPKTELKDETANDE